MITNHIWTQRQAIKCVPCEKRKNAPNCYFEIQCGSTMNMCGVKKEAINGVNNSDNSQTSTPAKSDQSSHHANAFCDWYIFDNRHATAETQLDFLLRPTGRHAWLLFFGCLHNSRLFCSQLYDELMRERENARLRTSNIWQQSSDVCVLNRYPLELNKLYGPASIHMRVLELAYFKHILFLFFHLGLLI